jgi:predicted permease
MSLKAFHLIFITAAIALAFGFGTWLIQEFLSPEGRAWDLVFGVVSAAAGVGLMLYERYFLKKTKDLSYL